MIFDIVSLSGVELSVASLEPMEKLSSTSDFLGALMSAPTSTLVMRREDLPAAFFQLSSGLAGEWLQKVSNYRRRLAVLGDFSDLSSPSFQQFLAESNRSRQVVFAPTLEAAATLLGA